MGNNLNRNISQIYNQHINAEEQWGVRSTTTTINESIPDNIFSEEQQDSEQIQTETIINSTPTLSEGDIDRQTKETLHEIEDAPSGPKKGIVVNCSVLNVRKYPSTNSNIMAVVKSRARLNIIESDHTDFYKVVTEQNMTGFCMKKYIEIQK